MAEPAPEVGPPEGWDNFANNLGSDLAPLLALFGEQVTKQYLSESLGSLDCILFAFAPLGIITAMVAAIRVAGEPWLRSLIGRAKEGRGDIEADLMSSTSSDVCELWNGDGIVRVLGRPVLLQLIQVDPPADSGQTASPADEKAAPAEDMAGIYTFQEAIKLEIYTAKNHGGPATPPGDGLGRLDSAIDTEADADADELRSRQNPPNLSLNVSVKPVDRRLLVFFVVLGFLVQSGVLVWAAFSQYGLKLYKNNAPPVPYGFAIFTAGTVVLALGMFGCAWAVDSSTTEAVWQPSTAPRAKSVLWLQQGGQMVGDQRFESWSRRCVYPNNTITTSHKSAKTLELTQNAARSGTLNSRTALVNIAIALAFVGFVLQFFGLRVLHSSVTLAQLGAILLMTLIRSFGHIQRENKNDIKDPDREEGHELDWLAKDLKGCTVWEVITGPVDTDRKAESDADQKKEFDTAMQVMKIRARLARISTDWELEIRTTVEILRRAIETTMRDVFANMTLTPAFRNEPTFKWAVPVKTERTVSTEAEPQITVSEVVLTLRREFGGEGDLGPWKIDPSELEAVLCLWVSTLTNANRTRRLKKVRLLGLATEDIKVENKLWIHRGTTAVSTELKPKEARYFGRVTASDRRSNDPTAVSGSNPPAEYLSVEARGSLEIICAQELHTSFLFQLLGKVQDVRGTTARRTDDPTALASDTAGNQSWSQFRLNNSNLSMIARVYDECGLGTVEDAYLCIVPAFRSAGKLPSPHAAYYEARKACAKLAEGGEWTKAFEVDSWLYTNSTKTHASRAKVKAITAEISARLRSASEKLVAECGSAVVGTEGNAQRVWSSAYALCHTIAEETSEDLATTLLNLYKICGNFKPPIASADPDAVFRLAFRVVKGLRASRYSTIELLRNLYRLRLPSASVDEIEKYLSGAASLKAAAKARVSGLKDDDLVPIDLRLARGYRTPLQMAAEMGHAGIVETLLQAAANINEEGAKDDGRTALAAAAGGGHQTVVKILLKAGADVNAPAERGGNNGNKGQTALQAAAGGGHTEVVRILLANGADCNAPSASDGRTALQAAAKGGHTGIVKMLLDLKADVNAPLVHWKGQTAMEAAAEGGHTEIVVLLLDARADLTSLPHRPGPLQVAIRGGHKDIVKLLLAARADVNAPPTPVDLDALQTAANSGDEEMVNTLLDAGAMVNFKTGRVIGERTALEVAAGAGYMGVVEMLLAAKAAVNVGHGADVGTPLELVVGGSNKEIVQIAGGPDYGAYMRTPLQSAAGGGHKEIVQILLAAGAKVDGVAFQGGVTALKAAAGAGHLDVVEILLAAKSDVNIPQNTEGRSVLQAAAEGGHTAVVELLLTTKRHVHDWSVDGIETPIGMAAAGGHEKVVKVLLDAGVDVNRGPQNALQFAAAGGHQEVVKLLIKARADLGRKFGSDGISPLQAAAEGGHDEVVELLLDAGANVRSEIEGRRSLEMAAAGGHEEVVKLLLKKNAEVDSLSEHREFTRTALQAAAAGGHAEVVELLIAAGANVNAAVGHNGRTALRAAAEGGHVEMVKFLASRADVNAMGEENAGRTALQAASEKGRKAIVESLLAAGADINAPPSRRFGRTALQAAAGAGREMMVRALLAEGADLNARPSPEGGRTALQAAAGAGHAAVVKLLLAKGANVNARPSPTEGHTALQAAAGEGHLTVVKVLLAAGANVNAPGAKNLGKTALQAAQAGGHSSIVDLLQKAIEKAEVGHLPSRIR